MTKRSFKSRYGPWAVITGAARTEGLGFAFASALARLGFDLVLIDVLGEKLAQRANELKAQYAIAVEVVVLDLGQEKFIAQLAAASKQLEVGLLICNHMFVTPGQFLDIELDVHLDMLHINARGYMQLAHHFGQQMVARKRGGVIMISSGAALLPQPYNQQYCAVKAYQLALAEALYGEWKSSGVDVLGVAAPLMNTFDTSNFPQRLVMDTSDVVEIIFKNLGKKPSLIPGFWSKLLIFMQTRLISRHRAIMMQGKFLAKGAGLQIE